MREVRRWNEKLEPTIASIFLLLSIGVMRSGIVTSLACDMSMCNLRKTFYVQRGLLTHPSVSFLKQIIYILFRSALAQFATSPIA